MIDKRLSFETHISKLCKKAGSKLSALARISRYMDANKLKILMRAFVISQFEYCPLVWMFHSRHLNSKINRIHETAVRIAYKDYDSSFNALLEKDDSVNIHVKHLRNLMIEMFKTKGNINPPFMWEIFCKRHVVYNLRNNNEFKAPKVRTTCYRTETIKYRGQRLWLSLPQHIRNVNLSMSLRKKLKAGMAQTLVSDLKRISLSQSRLSIFPSVHLVFLATPAAHSLTCVTLCPLIMNRNAISSPNLQASPFAPHTIYSAVETKLGLIQSYSPFNMFFFFSLYYDCNSLIF